LSKDQFITIRVSKEEKKLLKELAKDSNTTISKYILDNAKEKADLKNFLHNIEDNIQLSFFDQSIIKYCKICGEKLDNNSNYCTSCGSAAKR